MTGFSRAVGPVRRPPQAKMVARSERRRIVRMIGRRVVGETESCVSFRETWFVVGDPIIRDVTAACCSHITLNAATRARVRIDCPNCTPPEEPPPTLRFSRTAFEDLKFTPIFPLNHAHKWSDVTAIGDPHVTHVCFDCGAAIKFKFNAVPKDASLNAAYGWKMWIEPS